MNNSAPSKFNDTITIHNKYIYKIFMFILTSIIFFLNIDHMSEQGIYMNRYVPLANNLLELSLYSYDDKITATYPMWGYPILLTVFKYLGNDQFIFIFQYALVLISLIFYFKITDKFSFKNKILSSIIFIYYTMILSVKWPDAIFVFMLFLFAYAHINKRFLLAAIFLAIAYNFRSEALLFLLTYIVFMGINYRKIKVIFSLVIVLPWIIFQYHHHHHFIPTSTNSGGVLYISLGQLPNNKWNRIHLDGEAHKFVESESNGTIKNPWGYTGSKILTRQFISDIQEYPLEFTKKLIYNAFSIIRGGLYTIEPHYIIMDKIQRDSLFYHYKSNKTTFIKDLVLLDKYAAILLFSALLIIFSILFLFYLILYVAKNIYKKNISLNNIFIIFIALQMLITIFIQYQPRHISHVIVLFIFILVHSHGGKKDTDYLFLQKLSKTF